MKRFALGFLMFAAAAAFSQQLSYEVRVVSIEVPVRVKPGDYRGAHLAGYFAKDVPIRTPAR